MNELDRRRLLHPLTGGRRLACTAHLLGDAGVMLQMAWDFK